MKVTTLWLPLLSLLSATSSSAIPISQWTFETSVATPAAVDPNATASSLTLSAGAVTFLAGNAPTAVTAISGTGWNVSDGVKWWEFTVSADAGYGLNLSSLAFDDRASGTGPTKWTVTINGVFAASNQASHGAFTASPMNTVDLSAALFQGLGSANVKVFGFGASGASGTWRVDNVSLNGTVVSLLSTPDSGSTALLLLIPLLSLSAARRVSGRAG